MASPILSQPANSSYQQVYQSSRNKKIATLFIGCIPSTFFYGQIAYFLTNKSFTLSLSKWGFLPWSVVIASNLIYGCYASLLSYELSQTPNHRNDTNTRIALNLLRQGGAISIAYMGSLPYQMYPAEKIKAVYGSIILFGSTLALYGLAMRRLFRPTRN